MKKKAKPCPKCFARVYAKAEIYRLEQRKKALLKDIALYSTDSKETSTRKMEQKATEYIKVEDDLRNARFELSFNEYPHSIIINNQTHHASCKK